MVIEMKYFILYKYININRKQNEIQHFVLLIKSIFKFIQNLY